MQGLKDGEYDIDLDIPVEEVPDLTEEFFGEIHIEGMLRKFAGRFTLVAEAEVQVKLICDRSLKEFIEDIEAVIKLSFKSAEYKSDSFDENSEEIIFNADDKYLDITNEVREILTLSLPMKRVAPEYRKKDFSELYPEYSANGTEINEIIDDRWAPLKNLSSN